MYAQQHITQHQECVLHVIKRLVLAVLVELIIVHLVKLGNICSKMGVLPYAQLNIILLMALALDV